MIMIKSTFGLKVILPRTIAPYTKLSNPSSLNRTHSNGWNISCIIRYLERLPQKLINNSLAAQIHESFEND